MTNFSRIAITAWLMMACAGGAGSPGYLADYPSAERPPATPETRDRIAANIATLELPGLGCDELAPLYAGAGSGRSGDEVPGGYRTTCMIGEEGATEAHHLKFAPDGDELSITCAVSRKAPAQRCDELVAAVLK